MKKHLFAIFALFFALGKIIFAQENYDTSGSPVAFAFKYQKGDSYRILSTVEEDVFVNMRFSHHSQIINRVSATVTDAKRGSGTIDSTFMTSEQSVGSTNYSTFSWGEEYHSIFTRNALGVYTISDEYFMPTVRDVPVFSGRKVSPGESWTAQGHEAHDLRQSFGLSSPYKVPFTAEYTYLGTIPRVSSQTGQNASKNKRDVLHVIKVHYNLYSESPNLSALPGNDYPQTTMGYSEELIYWDAEKGAIDHYTENFRILMETAYGYLYEFRGTARAEVTDFERTSTKENVDLISSQIKDMGISNVTVRQGEKGLTLSLEDIKFKPDSAELLESEKIKIEQIAQILKAYPNNDILIGGHTALAGTQEERQILSEERANAVADYLLNLGVRDHYHVFTQGFGATQPIAPNSTEAGKAKNRRVEIIILDK